MLLSSELRKPIEKAACLAMTVRAIAYLAGQGQTMGHRQEQSGSLSDQPHLVLT
jgi:hypothetical protein